jgi:hypothetical protein
MRIALLISGHCRTFVFEEQRYFFKKFIKDLEKIGHCDVYLMLKTDELMKSNEGINNLKKMIDTIKPVYSIAFKRWSSNDDNCYYSQMKMIRFLVDKTKVTNMDYDYYIRIRPDCIIPEPIKAIKTIQQIQSNEYIYTSRKFDSKGNDQFFIIPQTQMKWFLDLPIIPMSVSPEYYIFNSIETNPIIKSGLVRDYKKIESWNFYHCHLNIRNYWIKNEKFIPISNDLFINKLKNIMHYQEVV